MILVLLDEPGLFVFPTVAAAEQEIEPIDAESEIRAAFDHLGVPYRVAWVRPNRYRKRLFGFFTSIEPGAYRLVPAGPADRPALIRLLETHSHSTQPPGARPELDALLSRLRAG